MTKERLPPASLIAAFVIASLRSSLRGSTRFAVLAVALCLALHPLFVIAHPADTTPLLVRVERHQVEFRFTMNLLNAQRLVVFDRDGDKRLTRNEIDDAIPALRDSLRKHILIAINDEDADLGSLRQHDLLWPNADTAEISEADFALRSIDLTFVREEESLIEDVWIGFDLFEQLGELHTVPGVFQQDGAFHEVSFSVTEPEYLYDTGYAEEIATANQAPPPAPAPASLSWQRLSIIALALCLLAAISMIAAR